MGKIDLSKFNKKPTERYLTQNENLKTSKMSTRAREKAEDKTVKSGRPKNEKKLELFSMPLTINFTEKQLEQINVKRGMVSASTFLRSIIKNAGIIE